MWDAQLHAHVHEPQADHVIQLPYLVSVCVRDARQLVARLYSSFITRPCSSLCINLGLECVGSAADDKKQASLHNRTCVLKHEEVYTLKDLQTQRMQRTRLKHQALVPNIQQGDGTVACAK